jgi:hypothetical protein
LTPLPPPTVTEHGSPSDSPRTKAQVIALLCDQTEEGIRVRLYKEMAILDSICPNSLFSADLSGTSAQNSRPLAPHIGLSLDYLPQSPRNTTAYEQAPVSLVLLRANA